MNEKLHDPYCAAWSRRHLSSNSLTPLNFDKECGNAITIGLSSK